MFICGILCVLCLNVRYTLQILGNYTSQPLNRLNFHTSTNFCGCDTILQTFAKFCITTLNLASLLQISAYPIFQMRVEAVTHLMHHHGVCLTVWAHADAKRSAAIWRTLKQTVLAKHQYRASSQRASRAYVRTHKTLCCKLVATANVVGVGRGPPIGLLQMARQTGVETGGGVNEATTRLGADKVTIPARARYSVVNFSFTFFFLRLHI